MALRDINREWDKCLLNSLRLGMIGGAGGFMLSLFLFKRKSFSVFYCAGLGIGCSYYECDKSFRNFKSNDNN